MTKTAEKVKHKVLALYLNITKIYGPYDRADGRKVVILYDGEKRSARQYAKIKLEVKLGRRLKPGEEVDHKDGNFRHNKFSNLQVLSGIENRRKSFTEDGNKPLKPMKGSKNPNSKLDENDIRTIRKLGKNKTFKSIAKLFTIHPTLVGKIVNRKRWKHVN